MYIVLQFFEDLQDNRHAYHVGDIFPREGIEVEQDRFDELASADNRRGIPLIKLIGTVDEKPKRTRKKK